MKPLPLVSVFRDFITSKRVLEPTDRLLVAVSGGLDSTTLAHLLHSEEYPIALAHCNFKLRGQESDEDANFVRGLAEQLDVPLHSIDFDVPGLADSGENTQLVARRLRYSYFEKILDEYNYDFIITAHHLQDSLETLVINLLRGTGHAGLKGISVSNWPIVRPLHSASREQILEYATAHGIIWREDSSNRTDDYLRNQIRHDVVPVLERLGLSYDTLARTFDRLRAEDSLLGYGYGWWRERAVTEYGDRIEIDRSLLPGQNDRLERLLISRFCPFDDFTDEQFRQMLSVKGSRSLESETGIAEVNTKKITFRPRPQSIDTASVTVDCLPFYLRRGAWHYLIEEVDRPRDLRQTRGHYFCISPLPLHLRPRKNGDRIRPFGMGGRTKKVKDLLTDLKLTVLEKAELLLLTSADDKLMAVSYLRASEDFRVGPDDRRVLRLTLTHENPDLQ